MVFADEAKGLGRARLALRPIRVCKRCVPLLTSNSATPDPTKLCSVHSPTKKYFLNHGAVQGLLLFFKPWDLRRIPQLDTPYKPRATALGKVGTGFGLAFCVRPCPGVRPDEEYAAPDSFFAKEV